MTGTEIVGLVLSGGGARGAYEAGAVSVLLPKMETAGKSPSRLVGTSAGALNVVALAGLAHQGWPAATKQLAEWWSTVQFSDVAHVPSSIAEDIAAYIAQVVGVKTELTSLLDTTPLRKTLEDRLPLDTMHANIRSGLIDAVAVAATSASSGGTVVFVEAAPGVPLPPYDAKRNIRYVATELTVEHVLASAAVPIAFRPVQVPHQQDWYVDGGVRLNTPLKPALQLGCAHLAVVATHPRTWLQQICARPRPDVFRSASLLLQAVLVDHMLEDLHTLDKVNRLASPTSTEYRYIGVDFVGPPPEEAHVIADVAREVRLNPVSDRDVWLLARLIGGPEGERAELLSFLLFHPAFTSALVEIGARHAMS